MTESQGTTGHGDGDRPAPGFDAEGGIPGQGAGYAGPRHDTGYDTGYGTPGQAPSGYAPPGFAPSEYAPSGYASPGYASPGYASPGYTPFGSAVSAFVPSGHGYSGPGTVGPGVPFGTAPVPVGPSAQRGRGSVLLAATAGAGILVLGAAVAALVGGGILAARADDVGADLGREIGAELGRAQTEQADQMMDEFMSMDPYAMDPYASGGALGPVEQFPPVEPGGLGPDPVLDAYAADCFAGDLQACDDLWYESPPLSAYEEYASTCGGRVKLYTVPVCTELE